MPVKLDPTLLPEAPDFSFEIVLWGRGIQFVAGVDEVGRGALAGPVAAAALVFPSDYAIRASLSGLKDSKKLSGKQRAKWAIYLRKVAVAWEVGMASNIEIDALGIVPATQLAMKRAIRRLRVPPEHILIDYIDVPGISITRESLVKGDERSSSIAGASILAKTARDALLCQLDGRYPGYDFANNKGYGTRAHRLALERLGPSPVHRLSFHFK